MNDLVSIKDGKPVTTSRIVAESFDKEHRNVLRDIDNIIASPVYQSRGLLNFEQGSYFDPRNNQTHRLYEMDRQGFEILAMGFTGEDALRWKFAYSDAFAAMEASLRNRHPHFPQATLNAIIERLSANRPVIPPLWLMMMWTLLEEIDQQRYPHPWTIRTVDDRRCLVFRTSQAVEYLSTAKHLQHLWQQVEPVGDRLLKKLLRQAGAIAKNRYNVTIGFQLFDHAIAVDLDALRPDRMLPA